jgi:hypothetical protein
MKKLLAGLALAVVASSAAAAPMTMVADHAAGWQYQTIRADLWPAATWATVDYSTYTSNATGPWSTGTAAFGNVVQATTNWAANTDLALQYTFNFFGTAADLLLNVAVDNGFAIFLNGVQVAKDNAEGFTNYWEYTFNLNPSALAQGLNVLQVLAEDHGGATYFDLKLSSTDVDEARVPVPATMVLLATGLLGLAASRRRR